MALDPSIHATRVESASPELAGKEVLVCNDRKVGGYQDALDQNLKDFELIGDSNDLDMTFPVF